MAIALIGGTGLNRLEGMEVVSEHDMETPWGACSHAVQAGRFGDADVHFIARHGIPHHIPPHCINYRANIWALRELGVDRVVAFNAVGGIGEAMLSGRIVVPDQLVDYTWGREHTFYDDTGDALEHIEFTHPYDPELRGELIAAAQALDIDCAPVGTYGATQGPRLETAGEIRRMHRDGCDIVGMTAMPEAALAAELGMRYASVCIVVNMAAGLSEEPITVEAMERIVEQRMAVVSGLLKRWVGQAS